VQLRLLALFSLSTVLSPLGPIGERVYGLRQELGQRAYQFPHHASSSSKVLACGFYAMLRVEPCSVSSTTEGSESLPMNP